MKEEEGQKTWRIERVSYLQNVTKKSKGEYLKPVHGLLFPSRTKAPPFLLPSQSRKFDAAKIESPLLLLSGEKWHAVAWCCCCRLPLNMSIQYTQDHDVVVAFSRWPGLDPSKEWEVIKSRQGRKRGHVTEVWHCRWEMSTTAWEKEEEIPSLCKLGERKLCVHGVREREL